MDADMADAHESGYADHEEAAAENVRVLGFAVITLSDTRTAETDRSGQYIREAVEASGHFVARYAIVPDDPQRIRAEVCAAIDDENVAVIVTNGGTGIAVRDTAYETIVELLDKRLDGFGELFRMLSYEEIGSAAMLSRAVGGISRGKVLFSLPGSTNAVRLGLDRLILPQAGHLYYELHKHKAD
jgi:molybdopterin adenylyltransferase